MYTKNRSPPFFEPRKHAVGNASYPVYRASAARACFARAERRHRSRARPKSASKDAQLGTRPACTQGQQAQCTNLPWLCLADGPNLLPWVPDLRSAGQAGEACPGHGGGDYKMRAMKARVRSNLGEVNKRSGGPSSTICPPSMNTILLAMYRAKASS